jgi:prepilin peptidase CpaA
MFGAAYFLTFAVAVAAVAAFCDWRTGNIPNWLTLTPLALAPVAHALVFVIGGRSSQALEAAGYSVVGALLCALIPLLLHRAGAIGGGDVKLLAALGAILRPLVGVEAEFYAFIAAALFAPARLAYEGKLMRVLGNSMALVANPFLPKDRRRELTPEMMTSLRFGPAIFVGTCGAAILHWRST